MKTVTMLEFRRDAERIIQQVTLGEHLVLTYRGRPVMRLEPLEPESVDRNDPFFNLGEFAELDSETLSNDDIDRIIYGQ